MKNENISYSLYKKVMTYMTSFWYFRNGMQFPELLEEAPYYLKEGILFSQFGVHIRQHYILGKCHVDLQRQICAALKTLCFFPGDRITFIGDIDHCVYFIQDGEVEVLSEDSICVEKVECILRSGDTFGFEQAIHPRYGHMYTYKVTKNSLILYLKQEDWIHLLKFFPASKMFIYNYKRNV